MCSSDLFSAVNRTNFTGAATLQRTITSGSSFVGYGSSVTGGTVVSAANIVQGKNTNSTSSTLQMQWRPKIPADDTVGGLTLQSDVLNLTGIDRQPFTLQMNYTSDQLDALAPNGNLYLGWLNTNTMSWVNAVAGNHAGTAATTPVLGAWNTWASSNNISNENLSAALGTWGVDTNANVVWAVLDHNSQFGVLSIPEPSTLFLMFCGFSWLAYAWRRWGRGKR